MYNNFHFVTCKTVRLHKVAVKSLVNFANIKYQSFKFDEKQASFIPKIYYIYISLYIFIFIRHTVVETNNVT